MEATGLRAHLRGVTGDGAGGRASLGAWGELDDPRTAALVAAGGFDWFCLDAQHGASAGSDPTALLDAVASAGCPPLVRVAWNRPEEVGRALDAGAAGVVVPMVSSAAEAAAAVAAARFPPHGRRSFGPGRTPRALAAPDPATADAATAVLVMVETPEGLAAVEEVAAVPGLDGILVGPFDLSLALGRTVDDLVADTSPASPLRRVAAACARAGVVAAAYAGELERARALRGHGFRALAVTTDSGAVRAGARSAAERARAALG